ncbi:dienelactone hydrolase family protein [Streptomyces minutiscleroticus]|uniref:dienelactone hydrolase family protein n=1 Tax=Streptomyces minutiscleroticus TaxID=68238 RepID=UPI003329DC35
MPAIEIIDLSPFVPVGGSRRLTGHLARPQGTGPWPGVVAVHEVFGANDVMLRQVERLAYAGYLAVMPDLFTQGGAWRCLAATLRAARSGRGRAYQDITAACSYLKGRQDCTNSIGVIGFCMGGGFALMTAARGDFAAASANYGPLPRRPDATLVGACPIVASYGGQDRLLPGAAARLATVLDRLGVVHDVCEYPEAGHGFLNDEQAGPALFRPLFRVLGIGPNPEAAAQAWHRIETFFGTHL